MGKLSNLRPAIEALPPRVGIAPGDRKARDRERFDLPWRKWYRSQQWRTLRLKVLERDLYTCQMCKRISRELVCDHIKPHRGNAALFWNEANLWALCKHCHDSEKQRQEKRYVPL